MEEDEKEMQGWRAQAEARLNSTDGMISGADKWQHALSGVSSRGQRIHGGG